MWRRLAPGTALAVFVSLPAARAVQAAREVFLRSDCLFGARFFGYGLNGSGHHNRVLADSRGSTSDRVIAASCIPAGSSAFGKRVDVEEV